MELLTEQASDMTFVGLATAEGFARRRTMPFRNSVEGMWRQ